MTQNPFESIERRFDKLEQMLNQLIETKEMSGENLNSKRILSKKQIKEMYGISPSTINRLMAKRKLIYIKLGRRTFFDQQDVEKCFEENRIILKPS